MAPLWRLHPAVLLLAVAVVRISLAQHGGASPAQYGPFLPALCSTDNNFTAGDTYQVNVDKLVHRLRNRAAGNEGFFYTSHGKRPDKVFGLAMCYAYSNWKSCLFCLDHAAAWVGAGCPYSRTVSVNYNNCLLQYSDKRFYGNADVTLTATLGSLTNATDVANMNDVLLNLTGRLSGETVGSLRWFVYGNQSYVDLQGASLVMYALVQCRRDLESGECNRCLNNVRAELGKTAPSGTTGFVLAYSCYIKYSLTDPIEIIQPPSPG